MTHTKAAGYGEAHKTLTAAQQWNSMLVWECGLYTANALVPWYLMASYLYYIRDESMLTDGDFDILCQKLAKAWDQGEITHRHAWLIDRAQLDGGSGNHIKEEDYPYITKHTAVGLMNYRGVTPSHD